MIKHFLSALILCFCTLTLMSQEKIVQAFNYDSETRDSMITFPEDDHNKWEKILMIYSMRCKDGLVSPAVSGQTNIGCGEWDYSCNTYITDSSQVDSIFRISPDHIISNFDEDVFEYQLEPTSSYYRSTFKEVTYTATNTEESFLVNTGAISNPAFSGPADMEKRIQYLIKKEELETATMNSGAISGIKLDVLGGAANLEGLKVRIKHTTQNQLSCLDNQGWQEVYYQSAELDMTKNWLRFYEDFAWNGTEDLLIDFSFKIINSDLSVNSADLIDSRVVMADNSNKVMTLNGSGRLNVNGDYSSISDQITIGFWSKGANFLPENTTFLEAVDAQNRRQVNIHLPWSNGQVYWDCGNNGGGYDRINQPADVLDYKDNWTHWTFTKNATTGSMKVFKNGIEWLTGTDKTNLMDIKELRIGSSVNNNVRYPGQMDDLRIWNTALEAAEIQALMCSDYNAGDNNFENLVLAYDFDEDTAGQVIDASNNQSNATIEGVVGYETPFARNLNGAITTSNFGPSLNLIRGEYAISTNEVERTVAVPNIANQVDRYTTEGTDLVLAETNYYYATGDMPVYDDSGAIIDYINVPLSASITIGTLEHYTKAPMQMEIMSFVTPYGINLDMGIEGESWTFDVTDLGPMLKGDKRIYLTRGGQWQEDMDIKFLFYEGTPTRNVKSVQQIWPVISTGYATIMSDERFEPRAISKSSDDAYVVAKTTITGHGQQGEFIPRTHSLSLDDIPFLWQVWMECADNPIYPQGGTWVYDRAGWCPGAPSHTEETDLTLYMFEDNTDYFIDYDIDAGSGDSRYIVNSQLVKYGPANFANDVSMDDIIYPSQNIRHGRFNPNCGKPKVSIKNTGSEVLSSATITYGIVGGVANTYEWTGNLEFLESQQVTLDYLSALAGSTEAVDFYAEVTNPNGVADEYENNNQRESRYTVVDMLASDVVIDFRTNTNFTETGYKVFDENGDQIFSRGPAGLGSNILYRDTLKNLNGCYKIVVTDIGENGLDWWANPNGGSGYVRLKGIGGNYRTIATDFGKLVDHSFVAGEVMVNTETPFTNSSFDIFPNPGSGIFNITAEGLDNPVALEVMDDTGRILFQLPLGRLSTIIDQRIDLSTHSSGMYFVKIIHDGGSVTKKLIKL